MDTEEICDYLTEQGVDKRDIDIIKASSYQGEVMLSTLKSDPERVEALGLSATCLAKLRALVPHVDCGSAKETKSRKKHDVAGGRMQQARESNKVGRTRTGEIVYLTPRETQEAVHKVERTRAGEIVYMAPRETQEAVITFGYSSSDED